MGSRRMGREGGGRGGGGWGVGAVDDVCFDDEVGVRRVHADAAEERR